MIRKSAILLATVLVGANVQAATYDIDPTHTYPNFTVNHLGFSTMHGRFGKTSGTIEMDLNKKMGSVDITIDASSIDTGFHKRDKHLRSPDFFNTMEFPEITFKSTKVTFQGKTAAKVEGKLTILGVSKNVTLDVDSINCGVHPFNKKELCGFNATTSVKRSDFGMKYGLPAIGDEININIEAEAFKK